MKNFSKVFLIMTVLSLSNICVQGRVYNVRSDEKFYNLLMKRPLAVAMFYSYDKRDRVDNTQKMRLCSLERAMEAVSKQGYYRKGGVAFIKGNIKNCSIADLASTFSISRVPAFILFKNGIHLKDKNGIPIMFDGWPNYEQLDSFIRANLKDDIEYNIKKNAQEMQKLREAERWSYLWYRPYLCGWPCYGGYGGYGGCGWGGGGCGWRSGCCRPSWGVGFGCGGCRW